MKPTLALLTTLLLAPLAVRAGILEIALVENRTIKEDINTATRAPHRNSPYANYSAHVWLRKELPRRHGHTGPDPVDADASRPPLLTHGLDEQGADHPRWSPTG